MKILKHRYIYNKRRNNNKTKQKRSQKAIIYFYVYDYIPGRVTMENVEYSDWKRENKSQKAKSLETCLV